MFGFLDWRSDSRKVAHSGWKSFTQNRQVRQHKLKHVEYTPSKGFNRIHLFTQTCRNCFSYHLIIFHRAQRMKYPHIFFKKWVDRCIQTQPSGTNCPVVRFLTYFLFLFGQCIKKYKIHGNIYTEVHSCKSVASKSFTNIRHHQNQHKPKLGDDIYSVHWPWPMQGSSFLNKAAGPSHFPVKSEELTNLVSATPFSTSKYFMNVTS